MSSLQTMIPPVNRVMVGLSETAARFETFDEARKFFRRPQHIHLVVPTVSDADVAFVVQLERTLYPYGTPQNDLFHLRTILWHGLQWTVISVPRRDQERVSNYCALHGRYLDRGVYVARSAESQEAFPFKGDSFRRCALLRGSLLPYCDAIFAIIQGTPIQGCLLL